VEPHAEVLVQPKKVSKLWSSDADSVEPFVGSENGFQEYQKAFHQGREMVEQERSIKSAPAGMNKEGLQDFIKNGNSVPDGLLDSLESQPFSRRSESVVLDEEAMMLAREALQTIKGSPATVASILKDILAARTEAAAKGIQLPAVPDEQRTLLEHWSRQSGPASSVAKNILSRIH